MLLRGPSQPDHRTLVMPLKLDLSSLLEHPEAWRRQGKRLLHPSEVLWHHAEQSTPEAFSMAAASLLGGYALENLLKAVRVKQLRASGEPIFVKGRLRRELTRHDLLALAQAARVPVARHERFLLERLTVTITWGGRYQAPKVVGETDSATTTGVTVELGTVSVAAGIGVAGTAATAGGGLEDDTPSDDSSGWPAPLSVGESVSWSEGGFAGSSTASRSQIRFGLVST